MNMLKLRVTLKQDKVETIKETIHLSEYTLSASTATATKLHKNAKYSDIIAGVDFVPFVIETTDVW